MVNNDTVNTQVEVLENGWTLLQHNDGYSAWLKTFEIGANKITVYLDNWSVQPISVHQYDLADIVIDPEWTALSNNTIVGDVSTDVRILKPILTTKVYEDVVAMSEDVFYQ